MKVGFDYTGISIPFYCMNKDRKLLLHKRSANCRDEHGRWDCGAGQLEFGESPEECVMREVKEEYGCSAKILYQFPPISVIRTIDERLAHWLAIPFILKVNENEVSIQEPHKVDEYGWFHLHELPSPLHSAVEKYVLNTQRKKILEKYFR